MSDKVGRPTKYKPEYAKQAEMLCKKGFIDRELAEFFGVDESTITRWKQAHDEFRMSLKASKLHCDYKVADALYNRAIGYETVELHEEDSESNGKKTKKVTKQVAGDTTAQIFWLKNRQPEMWRDRQETKVMITDDFDALLNDAADE